ncbi:MAG: helix-turn-helix domain-containing protein [Oscillospiraceae bacterium]|nr:helix-turn-helix domain-containing protein [Oscillospiraceae bacterium]
MTLGEKLLHARQEAGMSQRQLCGDVITRNMLSQIEHGTAKPSMETLRYLAARLEKPVSYFLEEDAALSPNQALMEQARSSWESGAFAESWLVLKGFRHPDPLLEWEWNHLSLLSGMAAAKAALQEGKTLYARQLLEEAEQFRRKNPELERKRLLLLAAVPDADLSGIVKNLPSLDAELLLRAEAALSEEKTNRAEELLAAVEDKTQGKWNLLMGKLFLGKKEYRQAAAHLQKAESDFGAVCAPLLETCFRELGDYQKAYEYACKQR